MVSPIDSTGENPTPRPRQTRRKAIPTKNAKMKKVLLSIAFVLVVVAVAARVGVIRKYVFGDASA